MESQTTMSKRYDLLIRLLLVGDTGVGKTCLLCQYTDHEFIEAHISTIGIDFKMKTVDMDGRAVKVQVWDTAGQERFEAITKQFYRRAQGIIVVYDICNRTTFDGVPKWLDYIDQFGSEDVSLVLIGNKKDRGHLREVPGAEADRFAKEHNMKFYETSAKYSENLGQVFKEMCTQILQKQNNNIKNGQSTDQDIISVDITENRQYKKRRRKRRPMGDTMEQPTGMCCQL